MGTDPLDFEIFAHIEVPHVARIHGALIADVNASVLAKILPHWHSAESSFLLLALAQSSSPLSVESQLEVVRVVKAVAQILLYLLFNWVDLGQLFRR